MQAERQIEEQQTQASDEMEEDEVVPFKELDLLQNHGINGGDIKKLKDHGLCTVLSCLMVTKKEMLSIRGITEAKAEKIYEAASKIE